MKIASFYNDLNAQTNGKLYDMVIAVVPAELPYNYEMYKLPQRQRAGSTVISEQFSWPTGRTAKEGSQLGSQIIEYLKNVEAKGDATQAIDVAKAIVDRLGQIVTKAMIAKESQNLAAKQAEAFAKMAAAPKITVANQITIA
jgi:hypothetical protein